MSDLIKIGRKEKNEKSSEKSKQSKTNVVDILKKTTNSITIDELKKIKNFNENPIDIEEFINNIPYIEFPTIHGTLEDDMEITEGFEVIGNFIINDKLNFSENLYLIFDKKTDLHYLTIDCAPFKFWHKIKNMDDLTHYLNVYSPNKYKNQYGYLNRESFYIGSERTLYMDMYGIQKFLLLNPFSEEIFWNNDYSYTYNDINKMSSYDKAIYLSRICDSDNTSELYVYSKYSKSLIKIENANGHYIVDIFFDTKKLCQIDVLALFVNLPFMRIEDILNNDKIHQLDIDICALLAKNIDDVKYLYNKLDETIKLISNESLIAYINTTKEKLKIDIIFDKFEKENKFKKMDKYMDDIIRDINAKCDDIDDAAKSYIDRLLRYKMNTVLGNKLMF